MTILYSFVLWTTSVVVSVFFSVFIVQIYILGSFNIDKSARTESFNKKVQCKGLEYQIFGIIPEDKKAGFQGMVYDPRLDTCVLGNIVEIKDDAGEIKNIFVVEDVLNRKILSQQEVQTAPQQVLQ